MKNLLLTVVITALLIAIFSTMGAPVTPPTPKGGSWPTYAGSSGVSISGAGAEPAEVVQQTKAPQETDPAEETETAEQAETETTQETTAKQAESGPVKVQIMLGEEQRTACNLVAVFLSGVAAVFITEALIYMKKE